MEARNAIGTEVDLRFTRLSDWIGKVEAHLASVPKSIRLSNNRIWRLKAEMTKTTHLFQQINDKLTLSEKERYEFKIEN